MIAALAVFFAVHGPVRAADDRYSPLVETARPLGGARALRDREREDRFVRIEEKHAAENEAQPIRFGGFLLFPQMTVSQHYTDNLYAAETDETRDFIAEITPSLYVIKEFGRHQADLSLEADIHRHWDQGDEDHTDIRAKMGTRLEARRGLHIPLELSYTRGHEKRDQNLSAQMTKEPLAYDSIGAAAGIIYKPNRLRIGLIGRYADLSFENGVSASDGSAVMRNDSDRRKYEGELSVSYDLAPNHKPFVRLNAARLVYDDNTARDSTNLEALAGWEFDYKGLVRARLAGGIGQRDYDDAAQKDITSARVDAALDWNISRVATLNLGYTRSLLEDNDVVSGALSDHVRFGFGYALSRDILLTTYVAQSWLDFENSARRDEMIGAGFALRYDFSPYHSVSAEYDYHERESTSPGIDHSKNTYVVRYNMKF